MRNVLLLISVCCLAQLSAAEYRPDGNEQWVLQTGLPLTDDMILLRQEVDRGGSDAARLQLAQAYLHGARRPGFDDWFHQAEQLLQGISVNGRTTTDYVLLVADIQQQQHQFVAALDSLAKVFQQHSNHAQASLMAARVYLAIDQLDSAQRACGRLWQQDLFLFSVCQYEVAGRRGQWQQSYSALQQLWQRQPNLPVALDIWLRGILAEQAQQLGLNVSAMQWLEPVLAQAPTSIWLKWADLSLSLGQGRAVYQQLSEVPLPQLPDSLLVRLARAEKQLGKPGNYTEALHERMQVRLARGDNEHAADVAHYFLYIVDDARAALQWAERNYHTAKEPDDKQLLTSSLRALEANSEVLE
jgi:predicted Zn-dependent protease